MNIDHLINLFLKSVSLRKFPAHFLGSKYKARKRYASALFLGPGPRDSYFYVKIRTNVLLVGSMITLAFTRAAIRIFKVHFENG